MIAQRIALQARNIMVEAGGQALLHRMSLAFYPTEVTAIIGPSGAGKSTLLKALCGFRRATDGRVLANGEELYRNFDAYRPFIGYVPQDDIIHRDLTVYKALHYAALLRLPPEMDGAERERRIVTVMGQLGLSERRSTLVRRLSGGQRKRVSIGVELLSSPPLLFLDEPTSGLDPGLEEKMMVLLQGLAREGRTVILTTHAMQSLERADFLAIINRGRLAFYGPPMEALSYFRVEEFADVFRRLETRPPGDWETAYRGSPLFGTYVDERLARGPQPLPVPSVQTPDSGTGRTPATRTVEDELAELKKQFGRQDD